MRERSRHICKLTLKVELDVTAGQCKLQLDVLYCSHNKLNLNVTQCRTNESTTSNTTCLRDHINNGISSIATGQRHNFEHNS